MMSVMTTNKLNEKMLFDLIQAGYIVWAKPEDLDHPKPDRLKVHLRRRSLEKVELNV